jgi:hypothetical protein
MKSGEPPSEGRESRVDIVESRGAVIAEIHPPSQALRSARKPGALRGQIWMADDFDALPEDVLASMEG